MPPEVTDAIEEAAETTEVDPVEEVVEEVIEEEPRAPSPDALARTEEIVREIRDKVAGDKNQPTQAQIHAAVRQKIKAETNMTDAQIDYMDNRIVQIMAPLNAKTVYTDWKDTKGEELTPEIEKGMKEYLKGYSPAQLGDPTLLDNVFYMELGKAVAKGKKTPAARTPAPNNPVIGRRIVPSTPAPASGLNGGAPAKTGASSLTKEELAVAAKMRLTPEEYAVAKGDPTIGRLKKQK